jgi:hypothetical protein
MPQGVMDLFTGFHSGMDAIPGRLGSSVREKGRVDGLASGVKEAGRGLVYGWWDGITGLVTEPIEGGKKEVCGDSPFSSSSRGGLLTTGSFGCAQGYGKEL